MFEIFPSGKQSPSGYVKILKHQKVKYPQFRQSKQGYWLIHTNPLS